MQYGSAMMKRNAIFAFLALAVASVCTAEDDNNLIGVSPYQIAYVTNAINELVAYPEAELPE